MLATSPFLILTKADTDGLVNDLKNTSEKALGVSDFLGKGSILSAKPTLVGGGTDGASCQQWTAQKHQGKASEIITMDVLVMVLCT